MKRQTFLNTSYHKNFDNLKEILETIKVEFSALCFSETWFETLDALNDSDYVINGYKATHQIRDKCKGGDLYIILNESFSFKIPNDLNKSSGVIKFLSVEIYNKTFEKYYLDLRLQATKR